MLEGVLATGHPRVATGTGFDFAPLILGLLLLGGMWLARFRIRLWMLPVAMVAGLVLDDLSDAFGNSMLSSIALILAVSCATSLRRTDTRKDCPPPAV
jgi:Na+-translocating ferredoxin:NAD+ oxidoreductase RnfD subunit